MGSEYSFDIATPSVEVGESSSAGGGGVAGPPPAKKPRKASSNRPHQQSSSAKSTAGPSSGSNSKSFSCDTCGDQFSRQAILNEHIRAQHLNERVKCKICGREFKRQNDRRRHETFQHVRTRAFQCKNGGYGCGKRFTRMDSLKEHQANPKKVGTTCHQAMQFARAMPRYQQQQQQQQPPPLPPSLLHQQHSQHQQQTQQPLLQTTSQTRRINMAQLPPPPHPPQAGTSEPPPDSYIPIMPGLDTSSMDSHDLTGPGLSPSVASDSKILTPREARPWLDWPIEAPQLQTPDPNLLPSHMSWPPIPETQLRPSAADFVALTATLTSAQEMAGMLCPVEQQNPMLYNIIPTTDSAVYDESAMWSAWNWFGPNDIRREGHN